MYKPITSKIYTTQELATVLRLSVKGLINRATREQWSSTQRTGRGGGKAYPFSTLPADVKAIILRHETENTTDVAVRSDGLAIPEWSHSLGLARYTLVAEWRTQCNKKVGKQSGKKVKKSDVTAAFLAAYNSGQILEGSFKAVGQISQSSLYRWDQTLRDNDDDYIALCDSRGKWTKGGAKGLGQLCPEAQKAFLAIWLTPNRPSIRLAYQGMKVALERAGLPVPSQRTAYNFAERFESEHNDVVVAKRGGEKALNDKVSPYILRDSSLLRVGDCLVADGHTMNVECKHPETGKPFRPTLILWYDWKSNMPVGWEFMPTENTIAISAALRKAIINLGMVPKVAYLDNGRAFKSKYFTNSDSDIELLNGLYSHLGITLMHAKPYHGQSKVVERFFGTMNEQFSRLLPSYTGRDITDKPAWRSRNEKYHGRQHEHNDYIPTLREMGHMFEAYVNWYAGQPINGENGQTHGEIFLAGRGPGVDISDLDNYFLWSKRVKPDRCGFTLAKVRYEADILYGLKKEIIVKYTWADLSEVYLYTQDGHSLGTARPQVALHPAAKVFGDDLDQAMVADANKRQASLKKSTMRKVRLLDQALSGTKGYEELPYCAERHEPPKPEPAPPKEIAPEEIARLDVMSQQVAQTIGEKAKIKPPEKFKSRNERYEWLFWAIHDHNYESTAQDQDFMTQYEASEEYREIAEPRYRQAKETFAKMKKLESGQKEEKETDDDEAKAA